MRLSAAMTISGRTTFLGTALFLCMLAATSYGQPSSPNRWLSEAPGEMVRLIDKGQVDIQIDDDKLRQTGKAALTIFRFALDFDYKFRAEWVNATHNPAHGSAHYLLDRTAQSPTGAHDLYWLQLSTEPTMAILAHEA